jgi:hypothetical protein
MVLPAVFLGTMGVDAFAAGSSVSWWQTLGGLIVVFGLLLVSLKLLGKWNRRTDGSDSSFVTVWHLGPKKEIQVLRLEDQVHFIYRHDGSMVVLETQPLADFENKHGYLRTGQDGGKWREALSRTLPFMNSASRSNEVPENTKERAAQG